MHIKKKYLQFSLSLYLSSSMTFRKRYIKLPVVLCASRQYIMSHVVIPPELHPLYMLLYIYIYTYFFYKSIHGINFDSWL